MKGDDYVMRKAELRIKQYENLLGAVYANWETRQIPRSLSHKLIESKIEYGIKFQFEYFILHLKSRLLKQIMKSILQQSTSNFYSMGLHLTWLITGKSLMIQTALGSSRELGGAAEHLIDGSEKHICLS